jgi:hypothetical protein
MILIVIVGLCLLHAIIAFVLGNLLALALRSLARLLKLTLPALLFWGLAALLVILYALGAMPPTPAYGSKNDTEIYKAIHYWSHVSWFGLSAVALLITGFVIGGRSSRGTTSAPPPLQTTPPPLPPSSK